MRGNDGARVSDKWFGLQCCIHHKPVRRAHEGEKDRREQRVPVDVQGCQGNEETLGLLVKEELL